MRILIVAIGAGLGGVCRYLVQGSILDRTGPSILALFAINVSGSFRLGLVTTLAVERNLINPDIRLLLTTGLIRRVHDLLYLRAARAGAHVCQSGGVACAVPAHRPS